MTWWEQSGAFLRYLARCQFVLRQGRYVADVCCYTGDSPYLHWGRGEKWGQKPSLALGQGYAYDLLNTDVLLNRLSAKDGGMVLPDGMRYHLLVVDLDDEAVPPEALRKIIELAKAGATVVLGSRRPQTGVGLKNYPACDEDVRQLAHELWGTPGKQPGSRSLGRGKIIAPATMDESLRAEKTLPDFEGPWNYIHRGDGETDIYFVAGTGAADCTFRVHGKEPELWDPVTGRIRDAVCYRATDDGRTVVPISLPENGSVFVVFRRPAEQRHLVSTPPVTDGIQVEGRTEGGARLRLWQQGRCVLEAADGRRVTVEAAGLPEPVTLAGPWEIRFAPGWGAPESSVFDQLIPWNQHPLDGIKHFSGTATYGKSFELSPRQARSLVRLQLGKVKHIAEVRLNGKPLGVVWTAPWTVDLTGVAKAGKNDLEIDVTNLWVNRLIGDAGLPEAKRLTRTNAYRDQSYEGRYAHLRGYAATDPLVPSGLLGPVRIEFGREVEVRF